jgi:hypothetical protein
MLMIDDIHHAGMLRDANAAGTAAPMSLNGHMPVEENEGWIDRRRRSMQEANAEQAMEGGVPPPKAAGDAVAALVSLQRTRTPDELEHRVGRHPSPGTKHRHRASTLVSLNPSPARPVAAQEHLTVSTRGSSSLQNKSTASPLSATLSHPASDPPLSAGTTASRLTISSLLDQLAIIHDQQQDARMADWDAFLKKRSKARSKGTAGLAEGKRGPPSADDMRWGPGLIGISQMGLGKSGQEEWKAFTRLVRHGIPLVYRSDVWAGEWTDVLGPRRIAVGRDTC